MEAVYLDHHATAPLAPAAREALSRWLAEGALHGNPSSVHGAGRRARASLEDARASVARAVGGSPREVVFTSGGTEALHLAVRGVGAAAGVTSVWCDPGAHPALRAACEALSRDRGASLAWLPIHPGGEVDLASWERALPRGALVALSLVQHETGAVASWRAVRDAVARAGAALVVDAVQALGKLPVDVGTMGAAAVAFSGHKVGGLSGAGALWLRAGERLAQLFQGGGQERGVRAGTENVTGALTFGAAASALQARLDAMEAVARRRDAIERGLVALGGVVVNGEERARVATACHVSLRGVAGEELVAALDLEGVRVSSGAACSSGRAEPSETLVRLYPSEAWRARSALRVTLGPETTDDDVARFLAVAPPVIARVRG